MVAAKYAMKTLHNAAVMAAVFGHSEEVEYLSGSVEANGATLLLNSESCDPDRDQAILREGDGRFIMHLQL